MPPYDQLYDSTVQGLVGTAEATFDNLVRQLALTGMPEEDIIARLLEDLQDGGPVFGPLLKDLGQAGQATALAAKRQGRVSGEVRKSPRLMAQIKAFGLDIDRALVEADPDLADEIEQAVAPLRHVMWVCALVHTCEFCLPLHGVVMTAEEWAEAGHHPSTIHPINGLKSPDYCDFIGADLLSDQDRALAPLKRIKQVTKEGESLSRKTVRDVTSKSAETSLAARDKLRGTLAGRRALRRLGGAMAHTELADF